MLRTRDDARAFGETHDDADAKADFSADAGADRDHGQADVSVDFSADAGADRDHGQANWHGESIQWRSDHLIEWRSWGLLGRNKLSW